VTSRLRTALAAIEGVVESDSAFQKGLAYWVNGKEIAHFEGPAIDIRLTREVIRQRRQDLKADPRVHLRRSGSDWLEVAFTSPEDDEFVIELVQAAAAAHRAPPGTLAAPPPTGSDLARRRRFH
jgi:luciferase-like monooxygenase